jgi:hypothetical protein
MRSEGVALIRTRVLPHKKELGMHQLNFTHMLCVVVSEREVDAAIAMLHTILHTHDVDDTRASHTLAKAATLSEHK